MPLAAIALVTYGCAGGGTERVFVDQQIPCRDTERGCPDLKVSTSMLSPVHFETLSFQTSSCSVVEGYVPSTGTFKLMRFDTGFANMGPGDLIVGSPQDPSNSILFEYSPCHNHYHFRGFTAYRLWTPAAYDAWKTLRAAFPNTLPKDLLSAHPEIASQMASGAKRSFCVEDTKRYGGYSGPWRERQFDECQVRQGITVGWMDIYGWETEGNWVDVTGLPPGAYVLEVEVNPDRIIREADYSNNSSTAQVQLP
jgi:hypothetical protein